MIHSAHVRDVTEAHAHVDADSERSGNERRGHLGKHYFTRLRKTEAAFLVLSCLVSSLLLLLARHFPPLRLPCPAPYIRL